MFDDLPEDIKKGFNPALEKKIVDGTTPHLCDIRKPWNRKAPAEIALPTEIYRELIERRKRYGEIKEKIEKGEITGINDFITFNLNIRQFAQDLLENTEDPDLIRHFFKAIRSVTVLDPTCGSGAFLFAALNIMEPLYEACIERMEQFTAEEPRKYKFFHEVLAEVNSEEHPNLQYYIYKSIILNNLYGVDIMAEAVEIAKLRLFLKMVGAVDMDVSKPNFGLEPLPDIDFNIRAGNTLVGFATEQELKNAVETREPLFAKKIVEDFEEEFGIVATTYKHFQNSQLVTDKGTESHRKAKQELQRRFGKLNDSLNDYLASVYGVDKKKEPIKYSKWLESHQPFHWFAEFYEIINGNGGFDVVIGNPPYVEYSKVCKEYKINNYKTITCGNLYVYIIEQSKMIMHKSAIIGFIVPISIVAAQRMQPIQKLLFQETSTNYLSSFALRPAALFPGVMQRLTILIHNTNQNKKVFTTEYITWYNDERCNLFEIINYTLIEDLIQKYSVPKVNNMISTSSMRKLLNIGQYWVNHRFIKGRNDLFYHNAGGYWIKTFDFKPYYKSFVQQNKKHTTISTLSLPTPDFSVIYLAVLNSSLFYFFWKSMTDARHVYPSDIAMFPINFPLNPKLLQEIYSLTKELMQSFCDNSSRIIYGNAKVDQYRIGPCKHIINEIDKVLAKHYGFTEEELDYIINFDIKYRMGKELFAENNGKTKDGKEKQ